MNALESAEKWLERADVWGVGDDDTACLVYDCEDAMKALVAAANTLLIAAKKAAAECVDLIETEAGIALDAAIANMGEPTMYQCGAPCTGMVKRQGGYWRCDKCGYAVSVRSQNV